MLSVLDARFRNVFFETNSTIPTIHNDIFKTIKSERAYELFNRAVGVDEATEVNESGVYAQKEIKQDISKTVNIKKFGFVINVSRELIMDNLFTPIQDDVSKAMKNSMIQTKERRAMNILNNGFTSQNAQDSLSLFNTAHTLIQGGTQSNRASVASSLDLDSFWSARNTMQTTQGQSTLYDAIYPGRHLVVPQALERRAHEILKSEWIPQSTENTANIIGALTTFDVKVSPLLTSTTAWFVFADPNMVLEYALRYVDREPLSINALFNVQGDQEVGLAIDRDVYSWRCRERYEFDSVTWYGTYGNAGA
jgi:phage major head subunit gpT-like protein